MWRPELGIDDGVPEVYPLGLSGPNDVDVRGLLFGAFLFGGAAFMAKKHGFVKTWGGAAGAGLIALGVYTGVKAAGFSATPPLQR